MSNLHDLISRQEYSAALSRLKSHPKESECMQIDNRLLAKVFGRCLTETTSPAGINPTMIKFVYALGKCDPEAVSGYIRDYSSGSGSGLLLTLHMGPLTNLEPFGSVQFPLHMGPLTNLEPFGPVQFPLHMGPLTNLGLFGPVRGSRSDTIIRECEGFTPLHAVCYLSRSDNMNVEATLATMIYHCPQAVHMFARPRRWLPLHAACAPDCPIDVSANAIVPPPPQVRLLEWLVWIFPGGVMTENKNGDTPLTMFWERYYVSRKTDGEDHGGEVTVHHTDQVWSMLRLMAEAAYYINIANNHSKAERQNCFRPDVVRANFHRDDIEIQIEFGRFALAEEKRRSFRPLVAFAGFEETTLQMILFAIERCRATHHHDGDYAINNDNHKNDHKIDAVDMHGNTPLHIAASLNRKRDSRCTNKEIISALITMDPTAASKRNHRGEYPISCAILQGILWDDGLKTLVDAFPEVLGVDNISYSYRLYPFLLPLVTQGYHNQLAELNTSYMLLRANPEAVRCGILK